MRNALIAAALASLMSASLSAAADDQPHQSSQASPSDSANSDPAKGADGAMKQCLAKQKATNSGLTNAQMQTTCKNEIKSGKMQKSGNDLATGPQAGSKPPQ